MSDALIPLLSALAGAVIGSLGTMITVYLQLRSQDRRERVRQAALLASEDRNLLYQIAKDEKRTIALPPMSLFMGHYLETLRVMETKGLSRASIKGIQDKYDDLFSYVLELESQRKAKPKAK